MRTGVIVHLNPTDRKRLLAIVDSRNSQQKHVWRARIVLGTADGLGTVAIMRTAGVSKTAVWRWQARFMEEGVEGLLRDKTRPPGTPRLPEDVADRVVALTLGDPPGETTHWTGRLMAKVAGLGLFSVQRIWRAPRPGTAPHPHFQAVQRSEVRRQGPRHRRSLCRSARPCRGAQRRREVADPGPGPYPAGLAYEEGSGRNHDPRL